MNLFGGIFHLLALMCSAVSLKIKCAVTATQPELMPLAHDLAEQFNFLLFDKLTSEQENWLIYTEKGLTFYSYAFPAYKAISVDFLQGSFVQRLKKATTRTELLAKAIGIKKTDKFTVIDATAGLGQDALVLAKLGCQVKLLERSPIIFALLQDGLQRFLTQEKDAKNFAIELLHTDAKSYLNVLDENHFPEIIYVDPMFPERQHSALARKTMCLLRHVVGDDLDAEALLKIALTRAKKRVVVKRPRLAPYLDDKKPDFSIKGKQQRLDVYLILAA